MPITKEILSIYLGKEPIIDLLLAILSSNNSYTHEIQKIAEDVATQAEEASYE